MRKAIAIVCICVIAVATGCIYVIKHRQTAISSMTQGAGLYLWTSSRLITTADLQGLSNQQLDIMRNEIYARHGWIFQNPYFNKYFRSQSWYHPKQIAVDIKSTDQEIANKLSSIEVENVAKILAYENGQSNTSSEGNSADNVLVTLAVGTNSDLQYVHDLIDGGYFGPESFCMRSDGSFYLLDTAKDRVLSYDAAGQKEWEYNCGDLSAMYIATGPDDSVYVLDGDRGIIGVIKPLPAASNSSRLQEQMMKYGITGLDLEPLATFGVTKAGVPYVRVGAITYLLSLANNSATVSSSFDGSLAQDGTIYQIMTQPDPGYTSGHVCIASIFSQPNVWIKQITIHTQHWTNGATYLGESDGFFYFQVNEFENIQVNDFKTSFANVVMKYNEQGDCVGISALPKQFDYCRFVQDDTVIAPSGLVHLDLEQNSIMLEKLVFVPPASFTLELHSPASKSSGTT